MHPDPPRNLAPSALSWWFHHWLAPPPPPKNFAGSTTVTGLSEQFLLDRFNWIELMVMQKWSQLDKSDLYFVS